MPMRIQELHPAVVHFPIALFPVTIAADLLGRATGSRTLKEVGRYGIALTAASAAISATTGLIAQEEVRAGLGQDERQADDLLVTHRNLNVSLVGLTAALAARRGKRTPGAGYFTAAIAGLAAMTYSAYLGGRMVYGHGLGVEAAHGVRPGAPALSTAEAGAVAEHVARNVPTGLGRAAEDLGKGRIVPVFRGGSEDRTVH